MATGTYFTTPGVAVIGGLMTQMQTSVRIGTVEAALNAATVVGGDNVYIGLQNNLAINIGEVTGVGFTHVPSYEYAESSNVLKSAFQAVTDLEVMATFGMQQLSPAVIHKLVSTGEIFTVNTTERIITGGSSCSTTIVPLEFSAVNQACGLPATPVDVETAIQAMIITLYRGQSNAGFAIDDIVRAQFMTIDTEWAGLAKADLPVGREYWSAYFF